LRFAALDLKELLHQSFATGYFYHSITIEEGKSYLAKKLDKIAVLAILFTVLFFFMSKTQQIIFVVE